MNLKNRTIALSLALTVLLALFGCSAAEGRPPSATGSSPGASSPRESSFPITLTDAAGREVTIDQEPQRLVSGYYITTSMLLALGQREKLVGLEAKADTRAIYRLAAPELLELPSVGTAKVFDLEGCAALQPDLVVLPLKLKDSAAALEELGIPVLTVNPENLTLLEQTVQLLGAATGAGAAAPPPLAS
jgi:iron complex transport system substrate-binding protein